MFGELVGRACPGGSGQGGKQSDEIALTLGVCLAHETFHLAAHGGDRDSAQLCDLFEREAGEQGVGDLGLGGSQAIGMAQNGVGKVAVEFGIRSKDENADRGTILVEQPDGSNQELQRAFAEGSAECKCAARVPHIRVGAGVDQGGEVGAAAGIGGHDSVDADGEAVIVEGDLPRGFVHMNDAGCAIEQDGCGGAGVEHGFGVAGAVLAQAECVANAKRILQVRHQEAEQLLVLVFEDGALGAAPQADDLEGSGGDGKYEAGSVFRSAGSGEVAVEIGLDELMMREEILALDDADAGIAQQSLAEGVGVDMCCFEGLLDLGWNGHASGGERAISQGTVVAQEEADARAGDVAQLGKEHLPLRLVERRRVQGGQQLGIGTGGDHGGDGSK
jgi:hypothetical protein